LSKDFNMFYRYFLIISFLFPVFLLAQVANDDCFQAIALEELDSWCSEAGAYTTVDATLSSPDVPSCLDPGSYVDVWFSFIALAPNLSLSIVGDVNVNAGGTIVNPGVAIYGGNCNNPTLLACESGQAGINQVSVFFSDLIVGSTYYIRVSSLIIHSGTFELCINNFTEVPSPVGDCEPGVVLCDKSSFATDFVTGAGDDPFEIDNVGCDSGTCNLVESSSTWYKWVCDEAGTLTFTINPLNPSDDLDFVLFELPNGIDDCSGKFDLRCMASGENVGTPIDDWIDCIGPTGLSLDDTDISESCGCQPGNNNFVEAINMESGKAYALVINNFSQSGTGFSIDWGGTGTFLGPDVDFEYSPQNNLCIGDVVTVVDASSFVGNITSWNWDFGQGAEPQSATGPGPHSVTFTSAGTKAILLQIETEMGCFSSIVKSDIHVFCCDSLPVINGEVTNVSCQTENSGSIALSVEPPDDDYVYQWNTGQQGPVISGLSEGTYVVTVSLPDTAQCEQIASFTVEANPDLVVDTIITDASICTHNGGAIEIVAEGGVPPIMVNWNNGLGWVAESTLSDLSAGTYEIDVADAANCTVHLTAMVGEASLSASGFEIPNVFTPNGDGLNDVFRVFGEAATLQQSSSFHLVVFNRWGQVVFETSDIQEAWKGEYKKEPAASDVYVYRLEVVYPCNEELSISTGEVTLLR